MNSNYVHPVTKYLLVLFLSVITLNSCKKEFAPIGNNISVNTLSDDQKVKPTEITDWLNKTLSADYQAQIQFSKAQQNVIKGQHVVKIPIGKNAALFFTKAGTDLQVFAYKWLDKDPGAKQYTGYITEYSFQTYTARQVVYSKGVITSQKYLTVKRQGQQLIPGSIANAGSVYKIVPQRGTPSGLGTLSVGDIFAQFWCWLTGGHYITQSDIDNGYSSGANGEVGMVGCDYSVTVDEIDDEDLGGGDFTFLGDGGAFNAGDPGNGSTPSGGGGGSDWVNIYVPDQGCDMDPNGGFTTICEPGYWTSYQLPNANSAAYQLIRDLHITDYNTQVFLANNQTLVDGLTNYLQVQGYTQDNENQATWGISYLMANSSVTFSVFANQFLGSSEGTDGTYDSAYWDDPNLSFTQQNLPSWSNFTAAFPLNTNPLYDSPYKMYNSVGGQAGAMYAGPNTNTCALRMSRGLNYSGITIPNIPGKTYKGADNKYYFLSAIEINKWMRKTFGTNDGDPTTPLNTNHYHYTGAQAGPHGVNLPTLLNGKKGIYSLVSSDYRWATGHADLLNSDGTCGNECHFYDAPILYIDVWVLN